MKFLMLEQKYLELLEDGHVMEALTCLRQVSFKNFDARLRRLLRRRQKNIFLYFPCIVFLSFVSGVDSVEVQYESGSPTVHLYDVR